MKKTLSFLFILTFSTFVFFASTKNETSKDESQKLSKNENQKNYLNFLNEKDYAKKTLQGKVLKIKPKEPLTLKVYSQFINKDFFSNSETFILPDSNFAKLLKTNFNVQFEFVSSVEDATQADIFILDSSTDFYKTNIENQAFLNWETDDLLKTWAPYLEKYFKAPLQKNRFQNSAQKYVHGIPTNLTLFSYETQTPIYNWQLESNYFSQTIELLKNKEIKTLDDFFAILQCIKTPSKIIDLNSQYQVENQKAETKTESEVENEESIVSESLEEEAEIENEEVQAAEDLEKLLQTLNQQDLERKKIYALSLYKDSEKKPDHELNIFAKEFVASYFGQESFYLGFYDSKTGKFQSPVEKNSVYIQALKFLNKLYQNDLINPKSEKYTKKQFLQDYQNNVAFWKYSPIFQESPSENQFTTVFPEDSSPIIYGKSVYGSENLWTISATSEHPELCLAIINYFSTPEGILSLLYGPKKENWNIKKGKLELISQTTQENQNSQIAQYNKILEFPVDFNSINPLTNKKYTFVTQQSPQTNQSNQPKENQQNAKDYNYKNSTIVPITLYKKAEIPEDFTESYKNLSILINTKSHQAIFAKNSADFDKIISELTEECTKNEDWQILIDFFKEEAQKKATFEKFVSGQKQK